jgi:hypothetical protein
MIHSLIALIVRNQFLPQKITHPIGLIIKFVAIHKLQRAVRMPLVTQFACIHFKN